MQQYQEMTKEELLQEKAFLEEEYEKIKALNLKLLTLLKLINYLYIVFK